MSPSFPPLVCLHACSLLLSRRKLAWMTPRCSQFHPEIPPPHLLASTTATFGRPFYKQILLTEFPL